MFVTEGRLHAGGLGLIMFSPSVLAHISEGADFMSELGCEPKGRLSESLVQTQRVALLGTGSPQTDYAIRVVPPAAAVPGEALKATEFGLWIEGGLLAIRDGYAPMDWLVDDPYELRFTVPDGYYRVRALWMPRRDGSDTDMHIDLVFEPTSELVPGDGWPTLMYDVHLEPPSPAERLISEVTLKVQAVADAVPAALRRGLDELRGTVRVELVEVLDDDTVEVEPPAIVTRTVARLTAVVDGCQIGVVVDTPLDAGDPLWIHIQSGSTDPADEAVLAAAADVFEHALAAIGTVVERSANF